MSKKILVITGSPRLGGNTDILADAFTAGAQEAGHEVIRFDAGRANIGGCIGCKTCFTTGHPCSFVDDFEDYAKALQEADMVAIFTPIYWYNLPSQLKAAMDRMYCFYSTGRKTNVQDSFFVICGGNPSLSIYKHAIGTYEFITKSINWNNLGHIVVPGVNEPGDVLKTPAVDGMRRIGQAISQ